MPGITKVLVQLASKGCLNGHFNQLLGQAAQVRFRFDIFSQTANVGLQLVQVEFVHCVSSHGKFLHRVGRLGHLHDRFYSLSIFSTHIDAEHLINGSFVQLNVFGAPQHPLYFSPLP